MEYELKHAGIKGMKWGIRRFQNKDGTLTDAGKKRYAKLQSQLDELDGAKKKTAESEAESTEQKRAKLLTSTDPKELYENRNLLTTNEINDRLNRINSEARLKDLSEGSKKSGYDAVDKVLKFGRKVNEVYEFTNTPVMKLVKKKLGLEEVEKKLGLDEAYKLRDQLSDKQLSDALKRANTEKAIKKMLDDAGEEARKEHQKQVDEYNEKLQKQAEEDSARAEASYSYKGKQLVNHGLDVPVSNITKDTATVNEGKDYISSVSNRSIAGYLPAPKDDDD